MFQGRILRTQTLHAGTIPIVSAILDKLGFHDAAQHWCGDNGDVPASEVLEVLVQARLAHDKTVPLSRVGEWARTTTLPLNLEIDPGKLNDSRLGRVLECAGRHAESLWMELAVTAFRVFDLDASFCIYDVTSVYFEGEHADSKFIFFGYNRDGKPGTKQVNVGLTVTGQDGIPMFYRVIPGNVSDTATVEANMKKLKKFADMLGLQGKPVVVGDRAMLTPAQMLRYKEKLHLDFIGCMQNGTLQKRLIQATPDELLLLHPLPYVAQRLQGRSAASLEDEKYYAYRVPARVAVDVDEEPGTDDPEPASGKKGKKAQKSILVWALVVLACGKRRLDAQKREDQLVKTEARLAAIQGMLNKGRYKGLAFATKQVEAALGKIPGLKSLLEATVSQDGETGLLSLVWLRNADAIAEQASEDGKYVVFFGDGTRTDADVFEKFKERDLVERRIGNLKGPIPVRPIYLHDDTRIQGLILVTMVALLVGTIVERQLCSAGIDTTIGTVQRLFSRFEGSLLTFEDYSQAVTLPTSDRWQGQVLTALGVTLPRVAPVLLPELYQRDTTLDTSPWPVPRHQSGSADYNGSQ